MKTEGRTRNIRFWDMTSGGIMAFDTRPLDDEWGKCFNDRTTETSQKIKRVAFDWRSCAFLSCLFHLKLLCHFSFSFNFINCIVLWDRMVLYVREWMHARPDNLQKKPIHFLNGTTFSVRVHLTCNWTVEVSSKLLRIHYEARHAKAIEQTL